MQFDDKALVARFRRCADEAGGGNALAHKTGIPRSTLETYFTGAATPKPARLAALCQATGINGHWLLTGEGPMKTLDSAASLQNAIDTIQSVARAINVELGSEQQVLLEAHRVATPEVRDTLLKVAMIILAAQPSR